MHSNHRMFGFMERSKWFSAANNQTIYAYLIYFNILLYGSEEEKNDLLLLRDDRETGVANSNLEFKSHFWQGGFPTGTLVTRRFATCSAMMLPLSNCLIFHHGSELN